MTDTALYAILINGGISIPTLIAVITVVFRFSRWTGVVDTKLDHLGETVTKAHGRIDTCIGIKGAGA